MKCDTCKREMIKVPQTEGNDKRGFTGCFTCPYCQYVINGKKIPVFAI